MDTPQLMPTIHASETFFQIKLCNNVLISDVMHLFRKYFLETTQETLNGNNNMSAFLANESIDIFSIKALIFIDVKACYININVYKHIIDNETTYIFELQKIKGCSIQFINIYHKIFNYFILCKECEVLTKILTNNKIQKNDSSMIYIDSDNEYEDIRYNAADMISTILYIMVQPNRSSHIYGACALFHALDPKIVKKNGKNEIIKIARDVAAKIFDYSDDCFTNMKNKEKIEMLLNCDDLEIIYPTLFILKRLHLYTELPNGKTFWIDISDTIKKVINQYILTYPLIAAELQKLITL